MIIRYFESDEAGHDKGVEADLKHERAFLSPHAQVRWHNKCHDRAGAVCSAGCYRRASSHEG